MSNIERLYYMLQENDCNHWFRDNADTLSLAEYLDKKGCIVPPCKVGDKLYIVADISKKIIEATIIGVWIYDDICSIITDFGTIHNKSIGVTVFFTREEAEQALKGGEG